MYNKFEQLKRPIRIIRIMYVICSSNLYTAGTCVVQKRSEMAIMNNTNYCRRILQWSGGIKVMANPAEVDRWRAKGMDRLGSSRESSGKALRRVDELSDMSKENGEFIISPEK